MDTLLIQIIIQAALFLYPAWRICGKAGINPWLSVTVLVPGFGLLICALFLAVFRWNIQPVEGE